MRILAISNRYPPWSIGGHERVAAGGVEALRESGHQVRVLTTVPDPSDRPSDGPPPADTRRELQWYWRDHDFPPLGLSATVALERANAAVLAQNLEELDPDAALWWAMGGMSLSLLEQVRRAGVPALGAVGDDWMVYGPQVDRWTKLWRGRRGVAAPLAERVAGVPGRVDLDAAAHWMFNSRYTLTTARQTGLKLAGATVAHPGVDLELFRSRRPESWGWRLLYCGRVDPRKGIATAIEALAGLPPSAGLTIHGDGDRRHLAELKKLSARLSISERVRFQSSPPNRVPAEYAAADAVVFPVRWREPWGLVPLEAMAVGRPVVASSAGGGAAEYLRNDYNCLQFPPGDATALAAALRRLAADSELRERLIAGGSETAARFSARTFHEALERELARVVDGARALTAA